MPHGISKKALEKFVAAVPWDKVVKKAEHAEQGTRLWPTSKSKDADLNFRIDKGANLGDRKSEMPVRMRSAKLTRVEFRRRSVRRKHEVSEPALFSKLKAQGIYAWGQSDTSIIS
ncbi:hypothetical protein BKA64DRAFT_647350 [Cadophora sp. MPI-SDFR-AT-0126]|nr:hypothetical protein BKA64DRAFT_647350 [Leotiomycetes sp. MPI-SDFR-AT-0126]